MSQKRLKYVHILDRLVNDSSFTIAQAAEAMGLSDRHVKRLKKEYKKNGIDALVHKNIGRPPAHANGASVGMAICPQRLHVNGKPT